MNKLWRAAPASPGAPVPNEDQSQASPEYGTVCAPCRLGAGNSIRSLVTSSDFWRKLAAGRVTSGSVLHVLQALNQHEPKELWRAAPLTARFPYLLITLIWSSSYGIP
jgi:hypothetical protein